MGANGRAHSNLQSFIDSITPSVKARFVSKSCFKNLDNVCNIDDKVMVKYFTLEDFWESYHDWSACGAAVPIRLDNGKFVTQYYLPTLSAMQIYTQRVSKRNWAEECTGSAALNADTGNELLLRSSSSISSNFWMDDMGSKASNLYIQFTESLPPYQRKPLWDKVHELAMDHPRLLSFNSLELSPASWVSVAWYPIYHIPGQRKVNELSAAFLTYHSLSSFFEDTTYQEMADGYVMDATKLSNQISFTPFGLATYKMPRNRFWINSKTGDQKMLTCLIYGADLCLKEHNVQQSDYKFFSRMRTGLSRKQ